MINFITSLQVGGAYFQEIRLSLSEDLLSKLFRNVPRLLQGQKGTLSSDLVHSPSALGTRTDGPSTPPNEPKLESWGEIAACLRGDIRTFQRSEKKAGCQYSAWLWGKSTRIARSSIVGSHSGSRRLICTAR